MSALEEKLGDLHRILKELGSMLVAFSGGCDSAFLLKTAVDVLGNGAAGLTASSPIHPAGELDAAVRFAGDIGARHIVVASGELDDAEFAANTLRRCYVCKRELFSVCLREARALGLAWVADGSNADDLGDFRPGREAAAELGVRSPLVEAGLSKQDVRDAARSLGLETWNKPALACLASRIPYGTAITRDLLRRIDACEAFLGRLGLRVVRVRCHGDTARIEVGPDEIGALLDPETRTAVVRFFVGAGFRRVTLDLQGYRTGSMNE